MPPSAGQMPHHAEYIPPPTEAPLPGLGPVAAPSHPMVTRSKAGIFKPRNLVDLASTALLSALTSTSELRGFKSAIKHPKCLSAMQEEIDALRVNDTWIWCLVLRTRTLLVQNGSSIQSFTLMGLLNDTRLNLWHRVLLRLREWISIIPLAQCLKQLQSG